MLSRTQAKAADSLRFGATRHLALTDEAAVAGCAGAFDLIISTLSGSPDTAPLLAMLDVDGALVMAGAPARPLTTPVGLLIGGRRSLAGTSIGGLAETQEMLGFCAAHGITAEVEIITAGQAGQLYDRLDAGDVRYRLVLDTSTL
ncbi:hypothetical protein COUCH_30040 [Couchioplanes caeruleus]|uniref:hypothetical protein n=1 Tax=Couchioplanes caeruleus TaxID=56438 RepID=UPI0020C13CF3|nr:hypothetical protein [Couchioplanes caeruleus]UQU63224.1 hypothetical protein COUCH_30040 [Couchioplanes caeruleus]